MLSAISHRGTLSQRGAWRETGRRTVAASGAAASGGPAGATAACGVKGVSSRPISSAAKPVLAANDCTTLSASGTKNTRLISVSAPSMA